MTSPCSWRCDTDDASFEVYVSTQDNDPRVFVQYVNTAVGARILAQALIATAEYSEAHCLPGGYSRGMDEIPRSIARVIPTGPPEPKNDLDRIVISAEWLAALLEDWSKNCSPGS